MEYVPIPHFTVYFSIGKSRKQQTQGQKDTRGSSGLTTSYLILVLGDVGVDLVQGTHAVELAEV